MLLRTNPQRTSRHDVPVWLGASLRVALLLLCWIAAESSWLSNSAAAQNGSSTGDAPTVGSVVSIRCEQNNSVHQFTGELIATDESLGHLLLDADGILHVVAPNELKDIQSVQEPLVPTAAKDLAIKTLKVMPPGSKWIATDHFVVCYNTSDIYARWNANLYERLYKGFYRFWKEKGVELSQPRFPMVALVFETKDDYTQYANSEFEGAENTIGYYHQITNRLASYDLTGIEGMLPKGVQVLREDLIQEIVSRPEAERTIATIVHEACHQIAFNSGLQVRLGDNPLWLSEGIAMFFESPDLNSQNGWGGVGKVNWHNFNIFRAYRSNRPSESLEALLIDDNRLRSGETMTSAYAESWALTYYLLKSKSKPFAAYLKRLREKGPGNQSSAKERLDLFKECFGDDLAKVDKDFLRFMQQVR